MKRSKFTEEQIAFALHQADTGTSVEEVCRKIGISQATFYAWKKKYAGVGVAELRRMRQLEQENHKLRQLVADLSLDKVMLQDVFKKKALRPAQRKELVGHLIDRYRVSIQRACKVCLQSRAGWYKKPQGKPLDEPLKARMREIASTRVRFGFWRIYVLMRREGWKVNHKRIYRLYKAEGLNLRTKRPRRRKAAANRMDRIELTAPNQSWSMDFVSDALFDGKKFRALTVVDNFTRECLAIEVGQSLTGDDVVRVLSKVREERGTHPIRTQADNGPEFISLALDKWAYENGVTMDFSRPGKPTDNAFIESFNGSFRDECLNTNWFMSLEDARKKIETWRQDYNHFRPHSSLDDTAPVLFATKFYESQPRRIF
ncbi:MAG: IS3 family transposase [Burkholderiales bacterium]